MDRPLASAGRSPRTAHVPVDDGRPGACPPVPDGAAHRPDRVCRHGLLDRFRHEAVRRSVRRRGHAADGRARCVPGSVPSPVCGDRRSPARPAGRSRPVPGTRRVGDDRARPELSLHRVPVGTARVQPGDGAAGRAAGQPVRRLRHLGARGAGRHLARAAGLRPDVDAVVDGRRVGRGLGGGGRVGRRADAGQRADARGDADPRGAGAGQRGAGRKVGGQPRPRDPADLHRLQPAGGGPWRPVHRVAGVGAARRLSGGRRRGRRRPAAGVRDARRHPVRQRSDRARPRDPVPQLGVPDGSRRHDRGDLPEDAPGAVRGVHPR